MKLNKGPNKGAPYLFGGIIYRNAKYNFERAFEHCAERAKNKYCSISLLKKYFINKGPDNSGPFVFYHFGVLTFWEY